MGSSLSASLGPGRCLRARRLLGSHPYCFHVTAAFTSLRLLPVHFARRAREERRSEGRSTGSPAAIAASRRAVPNAASASASTAALGLGASTSTRSPCSRAVFAVCGPIHAITVEACGLPAIPTRFLTVEDEVNRTASKPPPLIASRISAGGAPAPTR